MRALILLCMLLFVSSAWAQSQEIKKPVPPITDKTKGTNKSKDDSKGQQAITIELPPTINVAVGGKLELKSDNENTKGHEEANNLAEWAIAAFTGLLVFVTARLVRYTKKLWGSTQTAADDARKTATQQAIDTQASLDIAREAAKAATEHATATMASERAYVFVNVKLIDETQTRPIPTGFVSNFCNHGKTPAVITNMRSHIDVFSNIPNVMPEKPTSAPAVDKELPEGLVIASELIYKVEIKLPLTFFPASDIEEINGGSKFLICYGHIRYKDVFDIKRETGFCWQYSPRYRRFIYSEDSQLNYYK